MPHFFYQKPFLLKNAAESLQKKRWQINAQDRRQHIRITSDTLVYHIAGNKDRTDVVADREQNLCFRWS